LGALCDYPWPGNVREIETIMEQATLSLDGSQIEVEHLPVVLRKQSALIKGKLLVQPVQTLIESEKSAILAAGQAARGNLTRTAQSLGISRSTLWRKMKELNISIEDFN